MLGLILLFIAAFAYISSTGNHEWSGADSQAEDVISDLTGGSYHPGTSPSMSRPVGRSRACSSPCRQQWAASSSAISWAITGLWPRSRPYQQPRRGTESRMHNLLDDYAHHNALRDISPRLKLFIGLGSILICVSSPYSDCTSIRGLNHEPGHGDPGQDSRPHLLPAAARAPLLRPAQRRRGGLHAWEQDRLYFQWSSSASTWP